MKQHKIKAKCQRLPPFPVPPFNVTAQALKHVPPQTLRRRTSNFLDHFYINTVNLDVLGIN